MSKGSKRPGWKVIRNRFNRIGRELHAESEAARKRNPSSVVPSAINTVAKANERARATKTLCPRCRQRPATFIADYQVPTVICRQCITLDDRWFCGTYPCGLVYADRAIEVNGDYKRVAFLPYSTLVLEIDDPNSPLIERVKADAARMESMRGQLFGLSTCGKVDAAAGWATGQVVRLGAK
jgi:hypothetical protein